jgi:hypothetical protein
MIQGKDDDLIDEEQAWRLYEKAGEPKEIAIVTGPAQVAQHQAIYCPAGSAP